mmetsp:Transcript_145264/g.253465  ORF Transcript_145264/g.253465 Transcript_145264/m.253465 type:complete len:111 (+) Transcript_145264:1860-2192(+)
MGLKPLKWISSDLQFGGIISGPVLYAHETHSLHWTLRTGGRSKKTWRHTHRGQYHLGVQCKEAVEWGVRWLEKKAGGWESRVSPTAIDKIADIRGGSAVFFDTALGCETS